MQSLSRVFDPAAAVETVLATELAERLHEVQGIDPRLTDDVNRLIGFISAGGKRLRPQFLCWGWLAAAGAAAPADPDDPDDPPEVLPAGVIKAAAALELIQACALVHDDIIDRSDTRRGRPSVHRAVQKLHAGHGWSGDAAHYGVASALLLGDLALAWADDLFSAAAAELGWPTEAMSAWRSMRTEVLAGQLLDLRISAQDAPDPAAAAADAMVVDRYKTAAYTVERPLHLGAALAGAGAGAVEALRRYGTAIGIAFQLRDDLLGVFGDPAVTGKPSGGDLIEGKRTLLLALARGDLQDRPARLAELEKGIGRPLTADQVDRLTALVAGTEAPAAIEARITELFTAGVEALTAQDSAGHPLIAPIAAANLRRLALAATTRDR